MATSKQKLFVIILASWAVVGLGQLTLDLDEDIKGPFPCMQKLAPCQVRNQTSNDPVPETCCKPLRDMLLGDDKKCICDAFSDPMVLKKLNSTQDNAMDLVYYCGGQHKSLCYFESKDTKDNAKPSSPSSPPSPPPAHNAASRFCKSGFAASFIAALRLIL
ncbi:hypothetical protein ACLB2K_075585 [Fragaria x ananassa]